MDNYQQYQTYDNYSEDDNTDQEKKSEFSGEIIEGYKL